jgi:23S rRNA (uridine2552-2'-O)-methyltransferase
MKPGDLVVDLGAAPGGWLQVAAKLVGPGGKVIGVDLQLIDNLREQNVIVLQGDVTTPETQQRIKAELGRPARCVLSDLAPRLSGIRDADAARCVELNRAALNVAIELLGPGGTFLIKSFINEELQSFTLELKKHFSTVERTRPEATRQASSELYLCAKGFRAGVYG